MEKKDTAAPPDNVIRFRLPDPLHPVVLRGLRLARAARPARHHRRGEGDDSTAFEPQLRELGVLPKAP